MQEVQLKKIRQCIDKISTKPKYQRIFVIYMCFVWFQITYCAMIPSYVFMNPLFQCNGNSATQIVACQQNIEYSTFTIKQNCTITNDFTATYQDHLYCENKQSRSAIQSIFAFGALIGMFGLPAFADVYGRRLAIIIAFILEMIFMASTLLGIYQNYVVLMIIGSFINGIQCSGLVLLTYIITGQFCKNSFRQSAILLYASMWGLGQISYFFLYNYMPQWNLYLIAVILIPSFILMILSFFLIQSPEYCLVMAKDIKKFNKSVDKLGKYNQSSEQDINQIKNLAQQMLEQLKKLQGTQKKASLIQTMGKIVKNKTYIRTVICLALTQLSYNIFYYGVQGSLQRTGYNYGISMLLVGVHQFLAYLSTSYIINMVKRKKGLIIAIVFTSVIGLSFLFEFINNNNVLQSIVISITRIGCVYAYSFLSILQTQSFPAQIKSTAIGLTVGLSQCGRIAVPYLITAMNDIGIHPLIASSVFFLVLGIIPLIPIRQTYVEKQQEEIKQSLINQSQQD